MRVPLDLLPDPRGALAVAESAGRLQAGQRRRSADPEPRRQLDHFHEADRHASPASHAPTTSTGAQLGREGIRLDLHPPDGRLRSAWVSTLCSCSSTWWPSSCASVNRSRPPIRAVQQDQRAARAAQVRPGDARVERQHADRHAVALLDERDTSASGSLASAPCTARCRVRGRQDPIGHARHCGRTGRAPDMDKDRLDTDLALDRLGVALPCNSGRPPPTRWRPARSPASRTTASPTCCGGSRRPSSPTPAARGEDRHARRITPSTA